MSDIDKSERQLHPEARRLGVGVKIREKIRGSNEWWVFINYNGKRTSKKVVEPFASCICALLQKVAESPFELL